MIPFWKKTGKDGKKKPQKPAVPRTAQQSIPMQRMFEDGTCRVKANYYTRTIQYQDINYQLAQQEDKTAIFEELKKLPKTKDLSIEYAELLKKKKEAYPDYRKAQDEMQELMKAQKNVEMFFAEEKDTAEKEPTR